MSIGEAVAKGTIYRATDAVYDLVAQTGAGTVAVLFTVRYQNSVRANDVGVIKFS